MESRRNKISQVKVLVSQILLDAITTYRIRRYNKTLSGMNPLGLAHLLQSLRLHNELLLYGVNTISFRTVSLVTFALRNFSPYLHLPCSHKCASVHSLKQVAQSAWYFTLALHTLFSQCLNLHSFLPSDKKRPSSEYA